VIGLQAMGEAIERVHSLGGFYETAVNVKVFVFVLAFVFSLVAFLFFVFGVVFGSCFED
jgi:hypothetical protein